jgi:hypothetical protein
MDMDTVPIGVIDIIDRPQLRSLWCSAMARATVGTSLHCCLPRLSALISEER